MCTLTAAITPSSQTITSGGSVTLTASGGADSYTWSNGSTANPLILTNVTSSTTLSVTGVRRNCSATASATVSVTKPCAVSIAATPSLTIPLGGSVTLTASGATSYTWSNGSTQNPLVLSNVTSATTLSVTGVTGQCSDIATATVNVTQPGAALNLDGSNDYIRNTSIFTQAPTAFTIEFWIRPGTVGDYFPLLQSTNGWGGFTFHASANGGVYVGTSQNTRIDASATGANTITAGSWQHFAFTYANGTGTLYKNGTVVATKSGMTAPVAWNGFRTGDSNGGNMVNGSLDEFRVWNVARTQAQIQANYQCELSGSPAGFTAAGLVAYYNFNQGTTNSANTGVNSLTDASGNGNTAALNNFALSGSTSNWVAPGGVTMGNSCAVLCAPFTVSITAAPSQTIASGSSVTLTASGATSYTWSNGSTANPLIVSNVTSATAFSVTGTTGTCSATASSAVSVTGSVGTVLSITPPATLTIGPGNCPATLTFIGSGKRFEVTGPGGYYFPVPYRSAVLNRSTLVSGIKATGTYTIRAFGDVGQTPLTKTVEVTGTGCQ